jgi:membrane associated rhomboid family serine protease
MIPLGSTNAIPLGSSDVKDPTRAFPIVTVGLVVANVVVFLYELTLSQAGLETFLNAYALVPCEYSGQCPVDPGSPTPLFITLFTSMFIHGGWEHLLGNMLFLVVFGIHVERSMGPLRFLVFYFICGLGADALEIATSLSSDVPGIGASGAIAGVLAGYLLLYPESHINSLIPVGRLLWPARIPSWLFIGLWFLYQLVLSFQSYGDADAGVAYSAHVGGFITGLLLVRLFSMPDRVDMMRARIRGHAVEA